MNIAASLKARTLRFKATHFDWTAEGRQLKQLKDLHAGKRCFIIGNGPSLRPEDLTRMQENGDITFAFNRIYHIFDQTPWRPTYYISQDQKILAGSVAEVEAMQAERKFVPVEMGWYMDVDVKGVQHFHIVNREENSLPDFSTDISKEIVNSSTVVFSAAQIAVYMGIREIYLIGVDHHFQVSQNNKGEIVVDNSVKDYFTDKYNTDKAQLYIPNTEKSTLTYISMKQHCDRLGVQVYNATRGGKLEVFPRKDLDSLF